MTILHPADEPRFAALWTTLFALVGALGEAAAPAGSGQVPILLAARRQVRAGLRLAEGLLRRMLVPAAEAYIAELPPMRTRSLAAAAGAGADEAGRADPTVGQGSGVPSRRSDPWRFRLHEAGGRGPGGGRPYVPDPLGDHFGTRLVHIRRELQRFSTLVLTIEAPGNAIYRLALILRRRQVRAAAAAAAAAPDGPPHGSTPDQAETALSAIHVSGAAAIRDQGDMIPFSDAWQPAAELGCDPGPILRALATRPPGDP